MGTPASRIERVTVYREGARVERIATLDDAANEVRFENLPLALEDGSLRARVEGGKDSVAVDVHVGLDVPGDDASLAPAEDEVLNRARRDAERCRAEVTRLQGALQRLAALKVVQRPPPRDNEPPLPIPLESRQKLLALRTSEEQRLGAALAAANGAARDADKKLTDANAAAQRATTARNAKQHELRKVATVTLAGANKGENVRLEYKIPNACWSASYVITLSGTKAKLGMRALVAQRSGEDWRGVKLQLSTAQADVWVELPELAKARIGRAQPKPRKAGYREPPEGAQVLYADYDRVAGSPKEHEPPPMPAEELSEDEDTARTMMLGGAVAKDERGQAFGGAPPPARAQRMRAPMAMPPPQSVPRSASKSASIVAAPVALMAAPMAALGRALAPGAASANLDELSEEGATQTRLPEQADWAIAADALTYGRLRMRAPGDFGRGELVAVAQASVYLEALGTRVKVDVVAAIRVAVERTSVDQSALPQGYELACTNDSYDYLYAADLPCDVASDGAFHSVPVGDWDAETKQRYVAVPREAKQVYRVLDITSPIGAALLSGPLDVYEASSADGEAMYRTTTRMPPTPPRGRVEIGLGVEPAIKIARTTTFQEETAGLLGGSLALGHRVSVELRNLLPRPVTVEVRERLPVVRKDDTDVKVEVAAVEPSWEAWDQEQSLRGGHLWTVLLEPGATRTLSAKYTIKISSKLELVGGNRRES